MLKLIPKAITILVAAASFVFASQAFAQETPPSCDITTVIYYGNGIMSDDNDRLLALSRIRVFLKSQLSPEEFKKIDFDLANNATGGFARDLFESIKQDIQTDVSRFYRILSGLESMPDFFQAASLRIATTLDIVALLGNQDLQTQVNGYNNDLTQGKKVLVVAHSQGNFFANQSWHLLHDLGSTRGFGIVSVANPDSEVGGGGPYTTLYEDLLILGVRAIKEAVLLPLPMDPNVSNGLTPFGTLNGDPIGHSFLLAYTYFSSSNSATKIYGDILSTLNNLKPRPSACHPLGTLTATGDMRVTWGDPVNGCISALYKTTTHHWTVALDPTNTRLIVGGTTTEVYPPGPPPPCGIGNTSPLISTSPVSFTALLRDFVFFDGVGSARSGGPISVCCAGGASFTFKFWFILFDAPTLAQATSVTGVYQETNNSVINDFGGYQLSYEQTFTGGDFTLK